MQQNVFWEFDSIITQNAWGHFLLFCVPTWPSHHVDEIAFAYELFLQCNMPLKGGGRGARSWLPKYGIGGEIWDLFLANLTSFVLKRTHAHKMASIFVVFSLSRVELSSIYMFLLI